MASAADLYKAYAQDCRDGDRAVSAVHEDVAIKRVVEGGDDPLNARSQMKVREMVATAKEQYKLLDESEDGLINGDEA